VPSQCPFGADLRRKTGASKDLPLAAGGYENIRITFRLFHLMLS